MGFMSPSMPKDTSAAEEAAREKKIEEGMGKIDTTFSGFTPEFYASRAGAYSDYAMPQVEDQYKKAAEGLKFALARQYGTTETSEAAKREAELAKQYTMAKTGITDKAQDYATSAKSDVEKQRGALVGQLQATADPNAVGQLASTQADLLRQQQSFDPLGDLFYNVTEGLASAAPSAGIIGSPFKRAGSASQKPYSIV